MRPTERSLTRVAEVAEAPHTLSDVAKAASVSLATVDRVLNQRPGVHSRTAQKVHAAVERLNFRRDSAASRLARGTVNRLLFMLPAGNNSFMRLLGEQVAHTANLFASQRVAIDTRWVDVFDADALAQALAGIEPGYHGVAIVALDHPAVRAAVNDLVARQVAVVTLVSDVPSSRRIRYVGIDNGAAGRTAASLMGRFVSGRQGRIAVVMGSRSLRDHHERLFGFSQVMREDHPALIQLDAIEGRDNTERNAELVGELLANHDDLIGVYNLGAGNRGIVDALGRSGRHRDIVFIGHELTEHTRRFLLDGSMDAVIDQNPGHEARSAARVLVAHLNDEPVFDERERIGIQIYLRDNLP